MSYSKKSMQQNSPVIKFFFFFLFWLVPNHLAVWLILSTPSLALFLEQGIAWNSLQIYSLFFDDALLSANKITHSGSGNFLIIDSACTGLTLFATLAAALLAYPGLWKSRIIAVCMALLLLQSLNVLRISSLFFLIEVDFPIFQLFHLYVWQTANFFFSLLVFFLLVHFVMQPRI